MKKWIPLIVLYVISCIAAYISDRTFGAVTVCFGALLLALVYMCDPKSGF